MCNCINEIEKQIKTEKNVPLSQLQGGRSSLVRYANYQKGSDIVCGQSKYEAVFWKYCPFCGELK